MKLTITNKTGGNFRIPGTDNFLLHAMETIGKETRYKSVILEGDEATIAKSGLEKMKENGSVKKWIEKGLLVIKVEEDESAEVKKSPGRPPKQ